MPTEHHSTLIRPPPVDPSKSLIENVLELTQLVDIDPNLYTNTRPLWHPPGARGIFGGAAIAQCLSAAQRTVPSNFSIHSMHCYFVLAGNADIPIIYHVEHVRDGKSFITRTVQARQRAKPIFTVTMSFVRDGSAGKRVLQHSVPMSDVPPPADDEDGLMIAGGGGQGPLITQRIDILNHHSSDPGKKMIRQWIKARGRISSEGRHEAHLSALAYLSDSYFIGTVARVHRLRGPAASKKINEMSTLDEVFTKESLEINGSHETAEDRPVIGIMVSLDHAIYFHNPRSFRADEWLLTEMESPWVGDGRGLVMQRIYTKEGMLVATCVQEGLVRLRQTEDSKL